MRQKKQIPLLILTKAIRCGLFIATIALGLPANAADVQVGDMAPAFKSLDQNGNPWLLKDHLGGKYLVLYFYPAAMTGGCTRQACSYRDYLKSSPSPAVEIVGISGDTSASLKHFQQAEHLNFTLLADTNGAVARAYGVPVRMGEKSIKRTVDGKEVELSRGSTASRWIFVIDPQGRVVYRDTQVKAAKALEGILNFLEKNDPQPDTNP